GAYRILAGNGYQPKSLTGSYKFTADPPVAVVASVYNRSEINSETKQSYGSGMSEWCANCHDKFLENAYVSGAPGHRHPAGNSAKLTGGWSAELGAAMPIYQNYNQYVTSGIMNATATANYTTLVPFETGDTTFSAASTNANLGAGLAATATSNVMCLSCHRAHASGFPSMTRWNNEAEMMTLIASNGTITYQSNPVKSSGLSPSQTQRALYERPASVFGAYARVLCNKCHAKD
ncbi:MAG TPA: cytochrome C, partial [Nitrospirota bacterium]